MITKPAQNQYPEYYQKYIDKVPDGNILEIFKANKAKNIELLSTLSDKQAEHRYAEGKWSIKEVLGHIIDTERIFACRVLRMARNDKTNIPQYEHDVYVTEAKFDNFSISNLIEQYKVLGNSTLSLFNSFDEESWERVGISGGKEFIVKCFPYILAGHELHHFGVLKEKYLLGFSNDKK